MGREVFAAARRPGELLIVPGAGHNDVPEVGGRAYWTWLVRAIHAGDRERRYSRRSSRNAIGTLTDSPSTYFHSP